MFYNQAQAEELAIACYFAVVKAHSASDAFGNSVGCQTLLNVLGPFRFLHHLTFASFAATSLWGLSPRVIGYGLVRPIFLR